MIAPDPPAYNPATSLRGFSEGPQPVTALAFFYYLFLSSFGIAPTLGELDTRVISEAGLFLTYSSAGRARFLRNRSVFL